MREKLRLCTNMHESIDAAHLQSVIAKLQSWFCNCFVTSLLASRLLSDSVYLHCCWHWPHVTFYRHVCAGLLASHTNVFFEVLVLHALLGVEMLRGTPISAT